MGNVSSELKRTKRGLKIFFVIFFSIFLGIPLIVFSYFQYQFYILEKETLEYLYDNGYEESDIEEIDTTFQYGTRFTVKIIFVDEPQIIYKFIKRDGEILLLDPQEGGEGYEYEHIDLQF